MSVYEYDKAIVNDLRRITGDDRIHIVPTDNVFRTIAKLDSDKDYIELPIVSITRTGWGMTGSSNHTMKFDGSLDRYDRGEDKYINIQAIPIRITYLLDVWTKTREENDDIIREFIFYYMTHPTIKVNVPYNLDIKHNFNIYFDSEVEDNSDIVEQPNKGEYFRQTIALYTDDAYLWKSSSRFATIVDSDNVHVDPIIKS